ncbi:hypothetical protein [uncultured Shewanella sp.]|uniref:hypothetical protein n=1 Tax=uncultured Shewanella sp. TaxID=173975 RepID=UPI00262D113A|nr:hypothetical protein [uncultured Shewanella sp.]
MTLSKGFLFALFSLLSSAVNAKMHGVEERITQALDLSGQYECISVNNKDIKEIHTNKQLTISLTSGDGSRYQTYDINWVYSLNGQEINAQAVAILQHETLSLSYNLHFPNNKMVNGVEVLRFNQLDNRWFLYGKWLRNDASHNSGSISCVMLTD